MIVGDADHTDPRLGQRRNEPGVHPEIEGFRDLRTAGRDRVLQIHHGDIRGPEQIEPIERHPGVVRCRLFVVRTEKAVARKAHHDGTGIFCLLRAHLNSGKDDDHTEHQPPVHLHLTLLMYVQQLSFFFQFASYTSSHHGRSRVIEPFLPRCSTPCFVLFISRLKYDERKP